MNRPLRAGGVILTSLRLFARHFGLIATLTVLIFLPAKFIVQLLSDAWELKPGGPGEALVAQFTDVVFGSLLRMALIWGVAARMDGRHPGLPDCMRRGFLLWGRGLYNDFKVAVTLILWGALLVIPAVVKFLGLVFVDPVVALEERDIEPLARSRELAEGGRWSIFFVVLPYFAISLFETFGIYTAVHQPGRSAALVASIDTALAVVDQWFVMAALVMYREAMARR